MSVRANAFQIEAYGLTDIGLVRNINQDAFLLDREINLYLVADGMGGHKGGEVASTLAIQTMQEVVTEYIQKKEKELSGTLLLVKAARRASEVIFRRSKEDSGLAGMGTTLTGILIQDGILSLCHVGDSKAFLIRDGLMWQLTEDHTLLAEQIKAGLISPDNIPSSLPLSNVITRSLGLGENVEVDTAQRAVEEGDHYLLCSDGLTGMLRNREIVQVVFELKPSKAVYELVKAANARGGEDNVTVLVVEVTKRTKTGS